MKNSWNLTLAVLFVCLPVIALAEDKPASTFDIAGGKFVMTAPESWTPKEPRTKIIEHEFEVAASEDDDLPGRVTVMSAGGEIQENIDRWIAQFSQADGSETEAEVKELTIAGQDVHTVDIAGVYLDKPPFAGGGVQRENYRMLAAIIETKAGGKRTGNYFIKFYGPIRTVTENEEAFHRMLDSLSQK